MNKINASGIYIEVWERSFFLRVNSFQYSEYYRPAKRPAISIVIALNKPFIVSLIDGAPPTICHSMIVGPDVLRENFIAEEADLWVFDVGIHTQEYHDLMSIIHINEVQILSDAQHRTVVKLCRLHDIDLPARHLLTSVVYSLCQQQPHDWLDTRIHRALTIIDNTTIDELSIATISSQIGLSESRLRALFAKEMGCNLSRYIRFIGFWRAILLVVHGNNFTEAAHSAGFYDLPHFNRVAAEFSGFSPSMGLLLFGTFELHQQRKILSQ